jgi:hypothetical protein
MFNVLGQINPQYNTIKETIIQKNLFREEIKYKTHCVSQLLIVESCFCTTDLIWIVK